jgi:hypothetical protein
MPRGNLLATPMKNSIFRLNIQEATDSIESNRDYSSNYDLSSRATFILSQSSEIVPLTMSALHTTGRAACDVTPAPTSPRYTTRGMWSSFVLIRF